MEHFRHTPHISDIETQIRWEMRGIERGAQRVRDQMNSQSVGDGAVGLTLIRRVAPPLIEKIEEAQREAAEGIAAQRRGAPVVWWWLMSTLPADKLAVITIKSVLSEKPREFTFNLPVSTVAAAISRHAHTQLDFEIWKNEEADNEFLKYLRSNKTIDERSFKRFSDRVKRQRLDKWNHKVGINFGCKLIDLLCQAMPEWFSVKTNRLKGGRWEAQLMFSEEAKMVMADLFEHNELSRPMLLPMIVKPADWRIAA